MAASKKPPLFFLRNRFKTTQVLPYYSLTVKFRVWDATPLFVFSP